MLNDAASPAGTQQQENAGGETVRPFARNRTEGYVIECDGERAIIAATSGKSVSASEDYWAVGQLISVRVNQNRIVGLIFKIDAPARGWDAGADNVVHIHIELVGEIRTESDGRNIFSSGIAAYPYAGAIAHRIRAADLAAIYAASADNMVQVGELSQDHSIPALVSVDKLLSRHFAVVGTTGVGKSTAVTLLLRKVIAARPDVRVLLFDPHNEFTAAFPKEAVTVDASSIDLPFWLFKLDEFIEVVYRGRKPDPAETDALRDLIPLARERFKRGEGGASPLLRRDKVTTSLTADTPVPYRMVDLLALIEERIGQLEGKGERPALKALKARLDSILNDPRFRFMFGAKTVNDVFADVVSLLFRVPQAGKPICVFEMSGLPSEVVNAVVSVLCRMAFDLAVSSDGTIQTLVVCEEAHRYIPADQSAGFFPTRQAIARIAKEGRKYGVYLGVITQRPGELDATILSQCNTIFAMRLGNDHDQEIIRTAISGGARSTLAFLSSTANRECIAFGEAVPAPMRMMFEHIAPEALPGSNIMEKQERVRAGTAAQPIEAVIRRIRYGDDSEFVPEEPSPEPAADPYPDFSSDPYGRTRAAAAPRAGGVPLYGQDARPARPADAPQQASKRNFVSSFSYNRP